MLETAIPLPSPAAPTPMGGVGRQTPQIFTITVSMRSSCFGSGCLRERGIDV